MLSTDVVFQSSTRDREKIAQKLEAIALAHLLIPFLILVVALISFAFGGRMTPIVLPLSILITPFFIRLWIPSWKVTGLIIFITLLTYTLSLGIALTFFDGSYDGLSYHQEAVIRLAQGWNPVFENAEKYGPLGHQKLVEYFPKASWIVGAATFLLTGKIETGKLFVLAMMAAAWFQVAATLLRLTPLSFLTVALLSLLFAANPVAIYQSTTFLVDGLLASFLTILLASLSNFIMIRRFGFLLSGLIAMVLAINVKFNSLVYVSFLISFALLLIWRLHGFRRAIRPGAVLGVTVLCSISLFGYAPYIRNLIHNGILLYPLFGDFETEFDKTLRHNMPANVRVTNRFSRYTIANLSRTGNPYGQEITQLKFPLFVSLAELKAFHDNDLRSGGFGPLFGAILICTVLTALLIFFSPYRTRFLLIWFWSGSLLVTIFVHDLGWWARYTPQSWLLPSLFALAALLTPVNSIRWLGRTLILLILINLILVTGSYAYKQRMYTLETRRALLRMQSAHQPVVVHINPFFSLRQRFKEAGISILQEDSLPPENFTLIITNRIPAPARLYWEERPNVPKME